MVSASVRAWREVIGLLVGEGESEGRRAMLAWAAETARKEELVHRRVQ